MISGLAVDYESSPIKVFQTIIDKNGGNNIILTQTYNQGANVDNEINKLLKKYQYSEIFLTKLNKKAYLTVPTTENKNEIIIFNNNEVQVMIVSQNPLDEASANQLMDKLIEK
jgi:seryl-tRNA(Sec) selenium transferase